MAQAPAPGEDWSRADLWFGAIRESRGEAVAGAQHAPLSPPSRSPSATLTPAARTRRRSPKSPIASIRRLPLTQVRDSDSPFFKPDAEEQNKGGGGRSAPDRRRS
jgi:hypothetical protein